jgi:hypothetical protein
MNTLQYVEAIQQIFPNVSRNQIRLDLDTAQKILVSEVGSQKARGSLTNPSTNFAWSLPPGFIGLDDVVFYDTNSNPLYLGSFNYKYEIELGKFFIYSATSVPITGLDSSIAYAYIHYRELPDILSTESNAMEVVEQFRDAIESYVLGKYFSKFPIDTIARDQVVKILNLQAAQFHKNEYEKLKIKLKKYLGSQIKTSGEGQFYQDAGAWQLPKRPNDSTSGTTVPIAALSDIYAKYAYFSMTTADDGETLSPTLQTAYATISAELSGDTLTLISSGDFNETSIINMNNDDATYVRDSASSITITLPSGWTTFAFEIYERV